jgi:predicted aldo/keto reductase-like oxidoreductase
VQLPTNLGMTQSVVYRSQPVGDRRMPALDACIELGLAAFGSVPLLQGRAVGVDFPEAVSGAFPEAESSLAQALQFARSAPGVTAALVGVSDPEHAAEDFALARIPPAAGTRVLDLFV